MLLLLHIQWSASVKLRLGLVRAAFPGCWSTACAPATNSILPAEAGMAVGRICISKQRFVLLQGFLQLRLTGETSHLDVDTLNEKLQVRLSLAIPCVSCDHR